MTPEAKELSWVTRNKTGSPGRCLKIMIYASMNHLFGKVISFIDECETLYGIKVVYNGKATLHTMKRLRNLLLLL